MSIKDVIKSSIYEQIGSGAELSVKNMFILLLEAIVIGLYIYAIYKNQSNVVNPK